MSDLQEDPNGLSSLVVRTDFTDDAAWLRTQQSLMQPEPLDDAEYADAEPALTFSGNRRFDGFTDEQFVAEVARAGLDLGHLFFADSRSQHDEDHPVVVLNLGPDDPEYPDHTVGTSFRVQADQVGNGIAPNLALANMEFAELADAVATDGVFRGFPG